MAEGHGEHCRAAIPDDDLLLLVEYSLGPENGLSLGKMLEVMMTTVGEKEMAAGERRELLAGASFMLTNVLPLQNDVMILEARLSAD